MDKNNFSQRTSATYLGRKRLNPTYFENSLFRTLISPEPKNEYESLLLLYKNIFGVNWTEKFIRDNQQILDNISPNALWFLYSSIFFPNDLKFLSFIDQNSLKELFSVVTKENESFNVKKNSQLKNKIIFCDDLLSISDKKSIASIEEKLCDMIKNVRKKNEMNIDKLEMKIPNKKIIEPQEGFIPYNSILRDVSIANDSLDTINKYCTYLHNKTQSDLKNLTQKSKIFDIESEIKEIKDEDDWVCFICNNGDLDDNQLIYECESCSLTVHQSCYGIKTDKVEHWKCDCCKAKEQNAECILCSVRGGAMKKADIPKDSSYIKNIMNIRLGKDLPLYNSHVIIPQGNFEEIDKTWVHLSCALWNPDISFTNFEEKTGIKCIEMIDYSRYYEHCDVCNKEGFGPTIKCNHQNCEFRAHPECARMNKYHLEVVNDKGTLNYNIYCFKHKPLTVVKNILRRYTQKEEDIKEFANLLRKIYKGYEKEYHKSIIEIKPMIKSSDEKEINLLLSSNITTRQNANTNSSCSNTSSQSLTKPSISSIKYEEKTNLSQSQSLFISRFKVLARFVSLNSNIMLSKHKDKNNQMYYTLYNSDPSEITISYEDTLKPNFPWEKLHFKSLTIYQLKQYYSKLIPNDYTFNSLILNKEIVSDFSKELNFDNSQTYCYCKQKHKDSDVMICCEKGKNCVGSHNGWYHLKCIEEYKDIHKEDVNKIKFTCAACKESKSS